MTNNTHTIGATLRAAVEELRTWELLTGQKLPMPAVTIATLEQGGAVVDLLTGAIFNNADERPAMAVTPAGLALRHAVTTKGGPLLD